MLIYGSQNVFGRVLAYPSRFQALRMRTLGAGFGARALAAVDIPRAPTVGSGYGNEARKIQPALTMAINLVGSLMRSRYTGLRYVSVGRGTPQNRAGCDVNIVNFQYEGTLGLDG